LFHFKRTAMTFPAFLYHPDPVATGSVTASTAACCVCGVSRGYLYTGPAYTADDHIEGICPWCIADGQAHAQLNVYFNNPRGVGGRGRWEAVAPAIVETIVYRTPGFWVNDSSQWFTHCSDAACFVGPAGWVELESYGAAAIQAIRAAFDGTETEWSSYYLLLDYECSPTAFLFRCRHCGTLGGYIDSA